MFIYLQKLRGWNGGLRKLHAQDILELKKNQDEVDLINSHATLALLLVATLIVAAAETESDVIPHPSSPSWCQIDTRSFYKRNQAQLDAIALDPIGSSWYQNISVYAPFTNGTTGYNLVENYGYWQFRSVEADNNGCWIAEVQLWYRSENSVAIQQINSYIHPPQTLTPPNNGGCCGSSGKPALQGYSVIWVTPSTYDSAGLSSSEVDIISNQVSSGTVYVIFNDKVTGAQKFSEEMSVVQPNQRRFYSSVSPSPYAPLPLWASFDSYVVEKADQPPLITNAIKAWRSRQVPLAEDPAVPPGTTFHKIFLYTYN